MIDWEHHPEFDKQIEAFRTNKSTETALRWVNLDGHSVFVPTEEDIKKTDEDIEKVINGEAFGDPANLYFRDTEHYRAGELHRHFEEWKRIIGDNPSRDQKEVLKWITDKVSIFEYFETERPPKCQNSQNDDRCKQFAEFVREDILKRLSSGAFSLVGKVGECDPPYLVLPLTIEPTKPRLTLNARFVNQWTKPNLPFKLDNIKDLPRYVDPDSYQTILDDKSGFDHLLLTEESRSYFGFQWGGWYFHFNTLPCGWRFSSYIYQTTGLVASHYFRSKGVPCALYVDDRHTGQIQIPRNQGKYADLDSADEYNIQAAKSAIFIVANVLVKLGYFLNLKKSTIIPKKSVGYLGFESNSSEHAFTIIQVKREKFLKLLNQVLEMRKVSLKSLKEIEGKCQFYSSVIPGEFHEISYLSRYSKHDCYLTDEVKKEINQWKDLVTKNEPRPWKEERHYVVYVNVSSSGWEGGVVTFYEYICFSHHWSYEESSYSLCEKEALALNRVLTNVKDLVKNCSVDAQITSKDLKDVWRRPAAKNSYILKKLLSTEAELNISLQLFISWNFRINPPEAKPDQDFTLHPDIWYSVQKEFGGDDGHTCDLMALDSNAMKDLHNNHLPHFTSYPSLTSSGVDLFAQNLSSGAQLFQRPYVFPPTNLAGPVLRYLKTHGTKCTFVILDEYPRKYWWALIQKYSVKSKRLANAGDRGALLVPSIHGWKDQEIPENLWGFDLRFDR